MSSSPTGSPTSPLICPLTSDQEEVLERGSGRLLRCSPSDSQREVQGLHNQHESLRGGSGGLPQSGRRVEAQAHPNPVPHRTRPSHRRLLPRAKPQREEGRFGRNIYMAPRLATLLHDLSFKGPHLKIKTSFVEGARIDCGRRSPTTIWGKSQKPWLITEYPKRPQIHPKEICHSHH